MKIFLAAGAIVLLVAGVFYVLRGGKNDMPGISREATSSTPEATVVVEPAAKEPFVAAVQRPSETPAEPVDESAAVNETVASHRAFASDLYAVLRQNNGETNQFLSPYSISTILGLTSAGARGATSAQMKEVLHISSSSIVRSGIAALTRRLTDPRGAAPAYELSIANSLWDSKLYPMLPSFTALAEKYYDTSGVYMIDFRSDPAAARTKINQWIEERTMTRIKDLLPPDTIDRNTALVLANAIYFKGAWERPFDVRLTRNEVFHNSEARDEMTSLMRAGGTWHYFEDDDVQVVSLPFKTSKDLPNSATPSMVVVLPRKIDGLSELETKLTPESLGRWFEALKSRPGQVLLPKFTLTVENDLKEPLKQMGMVEAFDMVKADFRDLATPPPGDNIYISGVYHKAFIDVNEQGAEAAAATAVVGAGGGRPPEDPFILRADHPFFFVIRMEPSNEILFMGRLKQPTAATVLVSNSDGERGRGARGTRGRGARGARGNAVEATFKDPRAAASAALQVIASTRQDSTFVSAQVHPGLWDLLARMEAAANDVISGERPGTNALADALSQTLVLTGQIAQRRNESPTSKDKSLRLQEKLREIEDK